MFETRAAMPGQPATRTADFAAGKRRLLNVFASWCVPCAAEGPNLMRLKAAGAEIDGVAVHDTQADLARFLAENGNPYRAVGRSEEHTSELQSLMRISYAVFCLNTKIKTTRP